MKTSGNFLSHSPFDKVLQDEIIQCDYQWMKDFWDVQKWNSVFVSSNYFPVLYQSSSSKNLGFALFQIGPDVAHLLKIVLDPKMRGQGMGSEFWSKLESQLKEIYPYLKSIYLEVRVSNSKAIIFYQNHGFIHLNRIKSFYSDGEDAFAMHKIVDNA